MRWLIRGTSFRVPLPIRLAVRPNTESATPVLLRLFARPTDMLTGTGEKEFALLTPATGREEAEQVLRKTFGMIANVQPRPWLEVKPALRSGIATLTASPKTERDSLVDLAELDLDDARREGDARPS